MSDYSNSAVTRMAPDPKVGCKRATPSNPRPATLSWGCARIQPKGLRRPLPAATPSQRPPSPEPSNTDPRANRPAGG